MDPHFPPLEACVFPTTEQLRDARDKALAVVHVRVESVSAEPTFPDGYPPHFDASDRATFPGATTILFKLELLQKIHGGELPSPLVLLDLVASNDVSTDDIRARLLGLGREYVLIVSTLGRRTDVVRLSHYPIGRLFVDQGRVRMFCDLGETEREASGVGQGQPLATLVAQLAG